MKWETGQELDEIKIRNNKKLSRTQTRHIEGLNAQANKGENEEHMNTLREVTSQGGEKQEHKRESWRANFNSKESFKS